MIKLVGYLLILFSFSARALVPVEGILMGAADSELQNDPLLSIFSDIYDKSQVGENKKVKFYQNNYLGGFYLKESCGHLRASTYASPWNEKQARRSMAATLQYIGMDTSIKAIGAYAKKLEIPSENFKTLTSNLVKNYCSKNITVMSLRNIERSLAHYYENPQMALIPSIESSPFAPEALKMSSEKLSARSREFDLVLRNFRAFCSWGGQVEDYRLLTSYLNNPHIMFFVVMNMIGQQGQFDEKKNLIIPKKSDATVQVACTDLICRKTTQDDFKNKFPLSIGSTGLFTDLYKLYCHHFRFQDPPKDTIKEVKTWIKASELEDPIFETSQFLALMTGVPDLFNGVDSYGEMPGLISSSIDERWTKWSQQVMSSFSRNLYYEESLKIKVEPRRDLASLATKGFMAEFSVTLGEMDRMMTDNDKLAVTFDLKLSKNYLRSLRTKWRVLEKEVDTEGQNKFREEIGRYISLQLKAKEKLFTQKLWNDDFGKLIGDELLQQTLTYRGPAFNSYQEELLTVPVKFSYGLFAISYLRYRSDVAAGRLKLNL
jgi:hypothetical protein